MWPVDMKPIVVIADATLNELVLRSTKLITKSKAYDTFIPWLGTGLLISTGTNKHTRLYWFLCIHNGYILGEKWHKRRKLITPAFHFQILSKFVPVFNRCSDILIRKLEEETSKDSTDIYKFINRFALDTICGMYIA